MSAEAIGEFIAAMDRAGMPPAEPIADRLGGGGIVRFRCAADRKGRRNGWALLHLDGVPAGAFGNYKLGLKSTWRSGSMTELSPAERLALFREMNAAEQRRAAQRDRCHREVAERSIERWNGAGAVDPAHPYLVRKRVSGEGLRQEGGNLLVPMRDEFGRLWNLQTIQPDGFKLFAKGGRQQGLFCIIGTVDEVVSIGEGFATMATVRRATGHAVAIAFSASNLRDTALAVRSAHPGADIVIAADDDAHLVDHPQIQRNIGLEAAKAAARAVGGRVAVPPRGELT